MDLIELSRLQFALTALFHFIFVPLTIGMTVVLVIMESVYVLTGREIYRQMTQFWGKLFGINFALGVTSGITMEFQFGTNWAYYAHYVGDIFGAPLAIEGLVAFFLESTFIGLFFFGWERLSRRGHLMVTMLMCLGTNLSALWILVANGWMQNPVGAQFNIRTMRMEMTSFSDIVFNDVVQNKFVHTVSAGYVAASVFVMAVSSYYLLQKRNIEFAKKSFRIASAFGLASVLSVLVLGDESGYTIGREQQTKLAAIEAMWHTEPAPAPFNLIAWPNQVAGKNDFAVQIPWLMGLIGTRSFDKPIPGIDQIIRENTERIRRGRLALLAVKTLRRQPDDAAAQAQWAQYKQDLGFGLLLQTHVADVAQATDADVLQAARSSVPPVAPLFWTFRVMVAAGVLMLVLFVWAVWAAVKNRFADNRRLLWFALCSLPLPWLAIECGWFVAEFGRQPWTIYGVLPTALSASSLTSGDLLASISGYLILYGIFLTIELYLMRRFILLGPDKLFGHGQQTVQAAYGKE